MTLYSGPWWANGHDDAKLRRMLRERTIPPMARRGKWWTLRRIHYPRVLYTGIQLRCTYAGKHWPATAERQRRYLNP